MLPLWNIGIYLTLHLWNKYQVSSYLKYCIIIYMKVSFLYNIGGFLTICKCTKSRKTPLRNPKRRESQTFYLVFRNCEGTETFFLQLILWKRTGIWMKAYNSRFKTENPSSLVWVKNWSYIINLKMKMGQNYCCRRAKRGENSPLLG